MRNPIHKRLEKFESWQHITFMLCLCERMYPNFALFCQLNKLNEQSKVYHNILNLIWEYLTVKGAKINFESQLEKLEAIIPNVNEYESYGVFPAADACQGLSELLHAVISGSTLEQSILISQLSLKTVAELLEFEQEQSFSDEQLKMRDEIQQELDVQWAIYRELNEMDKRDVDLMLELKHALREEQLSNIGIAYK